MARDILLAIDQGTTGTTIMAVDRSLNVLAKTNQEFRQIFPKPGWVEHDLDEIWQSTTATMSEMVTSGGIDPARIAAIGITNQRETVGLWERNGGRPVHNAIVWQCRRTTEACEQLKAAGHEETVKEKTGLVVDPYFSGTKLKWLLDEVPGARKRAEAGDLAMGTIDTFLVWRLTGGKSHVTDVSNASRTLLYNIREGCWDPTLLDLLDVPQAILPQTRSSSEVYGVTAGVPGIPDGIPVAGMAGDQQAALFGQACFAPGDAKCTYGTGAFLLVNTGTKAVRSTANLLTTAAWQLGPEAPIEYALEGAVFCAGAAVQWLRDGLKIIDAAPETEALAASVENAGDVVFVPALTGLGAPHWNANARGLIRGITRGTGRAEIARATLEGIALQCAEVLESMRQDTGQLKEIRVDGGASANNLLMQIQANLIEQPVIRPKLIETTAAGAAFLAGLGVGLFESREQIRESWAEDRRFEPQADDNTRQMRAKWDDAVKYA